MIQEQFDEIMSELEKEKSRYNKEIIINNRKKYLLKNNQVDTKIMETIALSFTSMMIIFLGILLINQIGLLPTLPILVPVEGISLIISGTSIVIGTILQNKLKSKRQTNERIKEFSNANTQSELLQEEIEYTIEEEKNKNKKLIVQKVMNSINDKQNKIDSLSEEYTISKKESNQTIEDTEKNIDNLNDAIEEKYNELDYLTSYKLIYSNFEKKDNKKLNIENIIYSVFGGAFSIPTCLSTLPVFEKIFLNNPHVNSIIALFIPFTLGTVGTYTYLKKKEDCHREVFKNLKSELEENALSSDIEKKYNNGTSINKSINKIITEISRLRIKLEEEKLLLNSFDNEDEIEPSKSNDKENILPIDIQSEENNTIEKGPTLVKKYH